MGDSDPEADSTQPFGSPASISPNAAAEVSPEDLHEILSYIAEALTRFGSPGQPYASAGIVYLQLPNEIGQAPLGSWATRWQQLDEATRRVRTAEVARRLVQAHKIAASMRPTRTFPNVTPLLIAVVAFGLAAYGFLHFREGKLGAFSDSKPRIERTAKPNGGGEDGGEPDLAERAKRSQRVCEATRARVVRGATVSIADADGWVVEYMALKEGGQEPLHTHPALDRYFEEPSAKAGSKFNWKEEPNMVSLDTSTTLATVHPEKLQARKGKEGEAITGVRITFQGTLVDPYFRESERNKYFHVASSLSKDLGATHAGLYARCAAGATYHLGSWFLGADDDDAAAAMMFILGSHADPPHIAAPFYRRFDSEDFDHRLAFESITEAAEKLDRPFLASVLGRQGGHIMSHPGGSSIITFPFKDGNRSARASRELARLLQLAPQSP